MKKDNRALCITCECRADPQKRISKTDANWLDNLRNEALLVLTKAKRWPRNEKEQRAATVLLNTARIDAILKRLQGLTVMTISEHIPDEINWGDTGFIADIAADLELYISDQNFKEGEYA